MDKKAGTLVVDRFLYTPMRYPGNYGFIPHTLSEDGDPCDVLVANTRPIIPGAVIAVRPIGVLKMTDEGGGDEKIVAVPIPKLTQRYAHVKNIPICRKSSGGKSSTSSRTTRTLKGASGSGLAGGAMPMRPDALSPRRSIDPKATLRRKVDP
jgi:inorganic pyrophosphatase